MEKKYKRMVFFVLIILNVLCISAMGQYNVYCTGDKSCCVAAKEPAGVYTYPVFVVPTDLQSALGWMTSNGYGSYGGCLSTAPSIAVYNVYCTGDKSCCVAAKEPAGVYISPVLAAPTDLQSALDWMNSSGYGSYGGCLSTAPGIAVYNVYCTGDQSSCVAAKEPVGNHTYPQLPNRVDLSSAIAWMNANGYGSLSYSGCPSGQTNCSGLCTDTSSDSNNCGSCGNICSSGTSCVRGSCSGMTGGNYPQTLHECENGVMCGTWTLHGNQYYANWENGATATLTVDSWGASGVVINRHDYGGTSAGLSARYEGQLNGNAIENGKFTWTFEGSTHSGTWKANW